MSITDETMTGVEDDEEERYERVEFTIGVCVPMVFDRETGAYTLERDEVAITNGGLFSDAEEGPWVPEVEDWVGDEDVEMSTAHNVAHDYVASLLDGPDIEVIHGRDPDASCEHTLFVDGRLVSSPTVTVANKVAIFDVDPGYGYTRAEWDETTAIDCAEASPAAAEYLRSLRDSVAETSSHVTDR